MRFSEKRHGRKHSRGGSRAVAPGLLALLVLCGGCSVPIRTGLGAPREPAVDPDKAAEASARAYDTGNPDEAKRLIRNARDAVAENPGEEQQLARTLTSIAVTQSEKGDNAEAIALHEEALALRESALGSEHAEVADSLSFLAAAYYQAQRYDDAENAFRRALDVRQQIFGPNDRVTGLSMNNLAFFYAGVGKYDAADPLFRESIRIISESPDATWSEKARALDNYAAMLLDAGRTEDADAIQKEAAQYRSKKRQVEDIIRMTK